MRILITVSRSPLVARAPADAALVSAALLVRTARLIFCMRSRSWRLKRCMNQQKLKDVVTSVYDA